LWFVVKRVERGEFVVCSLWFVVKRVESGKRRDLYLKVRERKNIHAFVAKKTESINGQS
jgi:hypothetical protein